MRANTSRYFYVTHEHAYKVLEACPDAEWRLLFAFSRFGGLRCPSEHLALQWRDIDWERNRITVRSSKTEHHHGGESRQIPSFPELVQHLWEVFEQSEEGSVYVITRYRDTTSNLRTQLNRIIRKAGLEPWPKLWQNLRSTRETELAERHPIHVVCAWMGNSQPVAAKHYLQVTDEHFEQAARGAECGAQFAAAVQNAVQQAHAQSRTSSHKSAHTAEERDSCDSLRDDATGDDELFGAAMGDTGLELPPYSPRNTQISKQATHNPTHCLHQTAAIAPDLQRVTDAWPALPAAVRHDLLGVIEAIATAS